MTWGQRHKGQKQPLYKQDCAFLLLHSKSSHFHMKYVTFQVMGIKDSVKNIEC